MTSRNGGGSAGAACPDGFALKRTATWGPAIVTTNEHGQTVLVARVERVDQAERLLALAGGADAGGTVLTKVEYGAMRRDVEKWRQLEDDVAAGRKIVQDVPASVAETESAGGGDEKPSVLARVFRPGKKKH